MIVCDDNPGHPRDGTYVKIDDDWADLARLPGRPPKLSHSELLCLAVMQAMLGFHSEARWLHHARAHYRHLFPFIPPRPRLQQAATCRLAAGQAADPGAGQGHRLLARHRVDHRLDPGAVRDVPAYGEAVRAGRLGQLRLLRVAFTVAGT
jgi:hypothetical protein